MSRLTVAYNPIFSKGCIDFYLTLTPTEKCWNLFVVFDKWFQFADKYSENNHLFTKYGFLHWGLFFFPFILFPFSEPSKKLKKKIIRWFSNDLLSVFLFKAVNCEKINEDKVIILFCFTKKEIIFVDANRDAEKVNFEIESIVKKRNEKYKTTCSMFLVAKNLNITLLSCIQNVVEPIEIKKMNKYLLKNFIIQHQMFLDSNYSERKRAFLIAKRWRNGKYFEVLKYIGCFL